LYRTADLASSDDAADAAAPRRRRVAASRSTRAVRARRAYRDAPTLFGAHRRGRPPARRGDALAPFPCSRCVLYKSFSPIARFQHLIAPLSTDR
jgi:hypothetical protein